MMATNNVRQKFGKKPLLTINGQGLIDWSHTHPSFGQQHQTRDLNTRPLSYLHHTLTTGLHTYIRMHIV